MWTVKEKQADPDKHNAFKGAPVQISPSEAKHKASEVPSGLDSDFNLKKSAHGVHYSWFCTRQRSWRTGPHGRKRYWDKWNLHVRQQFHPSEVPDVKQCQVRFSKHLERLFVKETSRRINAWRKFGRWFEICEAICSCADRFRNLTCADLWIPWSSTEHRRQPDLEPWPFTSYPRKSDNTSAGSHSLLWPVPHSQNPLKPHHSGLNQWSLHYTRKLCFRRPNIVHFPQTSRCSLFSEMTWITQGKVGMMLKLMLISHAGKASRNSVLKTDTHRL